MSKAELFQLILSNKRFFVLIFCVLFGVVASESYSLLKYNKEIYFRKMLPKIVVALFVCAICTPFYDYAGIDNKYYPYFVMFTACVAMPVLDWVFNDFLPALLSSGKNLLISMLTKNKQDKKSDDAE